MPDKVEIEIKHIVSNPNELRQILLGLGAVSHRRHEEVNLRFDDHQRSLTARKMVLRLRKVIPADGSQHAILTVKVPAPTQVGYSSRREMETVVSDAEAMVALLGALGYEPYWRYEKRREVFGLGDVEADLDQLPYGWFLELEGSPDGIKRVSEQLGLNIDDGLAMSYAELFENVSDAMGLSVANLTFEEFAGIVVDPRFFRGK